ncbi:MAG: MbcA/ParS/Xre antitoxin family protein [Eubacteriales bacterium]
MSLKIFASQLKEDNWDRYFKYSQKLLSMLSDDTKNILDDVNIPHDIKVVVIGRVHNYAKEWLFSSLPILNNYRPIDLLDTEEGTKAVKEVLLRMPE